MQMDKNDFMWSDNWWIEGTTAWFVDGQQNMLFQLDLESKSCKLLAAIPSSNLDRFRINPKCIKYEECIYCMPTYGDCIWVYNIVNSEFNKINIVNKEQVPLGINNFWLFEKNIYVVSTGLKKVVRIDLVSRKTEYYDITVNKNEVISLSTKVGEKIYIVSGKSNVVYVFDMLSFNVSMKVVSNINSKLRTICYDGDKFWLSGYCNEIYIWRENDNKATILTNLPRNLKKYNFSNGNKEILEYSTKYDMPLFIDSIQIGDNVWFIPFHMNDIIYINKNTYEIKVFELENEEETRDSILKKGRLCAKYLVEGIYNNRYLILFSLKNNYIFEIDTESKIAIKESYNMQECSLNDIKNFTNGSFYEYNLIDRLLYTQQIRCNKGKMQDHKLTGKFIVKKTI